MNLFERIIGEIKKCPVGAISLGLVVLLLFSYDTDKSYVEKGTFVVLTFTLFALIWYSVETHRVVKLQHKIYQEDRKPLLSVNILSANDNIFGAVFELRNHRDYFTEAWVYVTLVADSKEITISDHYNGKKSWLIVTVFFLIVSAAELKVC